ncbi:MAG: DNA-directed RNA polymerase core subunit rpc10 [Lichina confinis]|nr:MAG: DNA-directed RNA polymerase core subunit rpc10 [Lichina confinis]
MSREQYQVPTSTSNFGGGTSSQGTGASSATSSGAVVTYLCGECQHKVALGRGDPIRCKDCGHRVLYKERTKRMVQFEAR